MRDGVGVLLFVFPLLEPWVINSFEELGVIRAGGIPGSPLVLGFPYKGVFMAHPWEARPG